MVHNVLKIQQETTYGKYWVVVQCMDFSPSTQDSSVPFHTGDKIGFTISYTKDIGCINVGRLWCNQWTFHETKRLLRKYWRDGPLHDNSLTGMNECMHEIKNCIFNEMAGCMNVCMCVVFHCIYVNLNVNVSVYSLKSQLSSADFTIYAPGIGTLSYTVSSPLGRIQHLRTLLQL